MAKILKIKASFFLILFLVTSVLTIIGFINKQSDVDIKISVNDELYNPELSRLNSLSKMCVYIDSIYKHTGIKTFDTASYVNLVSQTTKERFYFGLSNYRMSENWIAFFSSKFIWTHLSAIVIPNDILKHSEGLCSQQTIVFMEILKQKGIKTRSVGLGVKEGPGHFICEVYYNNSWRLHDVTKEPQWPKIRNDHESMNYYLSNRDSLYKVYEYKMTKIEYDKLLQSIHYGELNTFPAKRMLLFHKITKVLTYILPLIFLFIYFHYYKKYKAAL